MRTNFLAGLSCELYAASWFVDTGYTIYWPMSTQSRCDFVIEKDNLFQKVQVKKATWSQTGNYKYLQCRLMNRNTHSKWYIEGDYDLLIFVDDDKRLWLTTFETVNKLVSVCLDGTKENYRTQSKLYNPDDWRVK